MSFHAYLFFSGDCAAAFERYGEIFGGEVTVMRNGDVPAEDRMPGTPDESVMHASLRIGENALLMGSDDPTGDDGRKVGFSVSYTAPDLPAAERVYEQLADGGDAQMPIAKTFWSEGFGMCTDRFGVPWMIDVDQAPE